MNPNVRYRSWSLDSPQADEGMEVREDSWTQTVNQFIWEQAQKSKPKEAQSQYRTAKIVWTNKWKNIRTDLFDTYLRYKRLSDEGDIFLGIEHLNKRCKCTSTKSRDVAFIDRDNHCYESVPFCKCIPDPVRLLARGFIAVSPDTPKTAISISLVQYFERIRESVPMSVSGFAEGLWRCHTLRGEAHSSHIPHRPRNGGPLLRQALFVFRDLLLQEAQFNREVLPLDPLEELSTKSVQPVLDPVSKGICKPVIATIFSPPTAISVTLDLPQLPRMTSPFERYDGVT
ncbi:hypothetical protein CNBG_3932 [Cryptococcus deuterogattii R265]|uniref:CxC1-like cysteine cluster associated with KDZ transposases domain-containing protein n=1 Tax=Cryptococcus deuterogattii (strain R265) TaxID=294750 RepID=A0A095CCX4_CRYD2|nr:hypothetical protein CNBG_3932 [Cryptococcus deuterogattii R265]KIR70752.1 hypothetical protein I310_05603 [Cryptococcus deuterogattii CA1014]